MFRLVSMAGAAALMASTAFADTTPTNVAPPAAPASTTAAPAKATPPVVAATEKPATPAAEPTASEAQQAAAKMRFAKARKAQEARDDRLTAALNTLESKGYTSFQDLKAEGQNVAVVAIKNGKTTKVDVTPSGEVLPST